MALLEHGPGPMRGTERRSRSGFTLIELAIVMVVAGLLLVPLLRMAGSAVVSTRLKETRSTLETASAALISFAAAHDGCLPFASDFEGGQPNTDAGGVATANPDTGFRNGNQRAGDLPWAELGLTNEFLDGDNLRIQYYVASPYTDITGTYPRDCDAGFRGFQWDTSVDYSAPANAPIWVYDLNPPSTGVRTLFEIQQGSTLAAGTHPVNGGGSITIHGDQLPATLLEVRKGPDVTAAAPESDVISSQNVFILIAPGPNRNTVAGLQFSRDSTHTGAGGGAWPIGANTVDDKIFSTEPNVDAADTANSGDDTMLIMSFTQFKAEMSKHGLNMEPVCENPC